MLTLLTLLTVADPDPLDRHTRSAMTAWNVPAVQLVVVQKDRPTILRSFGGTVDDAFPIASCTKAFTSALIANLVDEGRMAWDDPVRKHLPTFRLSEPHANALVTIRDLLCHRTGVNGHDLLWYHSKLSNDELISRTGKLPVVEPFRSSYQYSSLMVIAAGQAAANAAGRPWHDAVKERVTGPLGMKTVTFTTTDAAFVNAPKLPGHDREGRPMPRYEIASPNPAGSMQMTLRDLEPWLKHLLSAKGALKDTMTPHVVIPLPEAQKRYQPDTVQMCYGLGWIVSDYRGHRIVSHGGMIDGFRTLIVFAPDDGVAFAIIANRHETKMNAALANNLLDDYLNLPAKDWNGIHQKVFADELAEKERHWAAVLKQREQMKPLALPLEQYAGEYRNDAYGSGTVVHKDGKLVWNWSTFTAPLDYFGNDAFLIAGGVMDKLPVEFQSKDGAVKALRFQGQVFTR